jgi:hypothetical protein
MAQSQVRLFLAAPTDRQTRLLPPGRKSLCDFDHAKPNLREAICDRQSMITAPALKWSISRVPFIFRN